MPPATIHCPRCGSKAPWEQNPHRPFCSERCRLIDLEAWLSGRYAIPGEAVREPASDLLETDDEESQGNDGVGGGRRTSPPP